MFIFTVSKKEFKFHQKIAKRMIFNDISNGKAIENATKALMTSENPNNTGLWQRFCSSRKSDMPQAQPKVIFLFTDDGIMREETAEKMNCTPEAVRKNISRGRQKINEQIFILNNKYN